MTTMIKLKDYKLRTNGNSKGKLVQIPVAVIREWNLGPDDMVEIYKTTDGELVIKPKKGVYNERDKVDSEQSCIS